MIAIVIFSRYPLSDIKRVKLPSLTDDLNRYLIVAKLINFDIFIAGVHTNPVMSNNV